MPVRIISTQQRVTAFLEGEIDHHTAAALRMEIDEAVQLNKPKTLKLDFSDVSFMDSSGIAVVINALREMNRMDGRLILSGLLDQPRKVFSASGIDKLVEIKERVL